MCFKRRVLRKNSPHVEAGDNHSFVPRQSMAVTDFSISGAAPATKISRHCTSQQFDKGIARDHLRISYGTGVVPPPDSEERHGSSSFYELNVESSRYLVAYQHTASFEGVQFRPKSLRLIFVTAEIAIRVLPQGSLVGGVGPSTAKWTLRVTL